MKNKATIILSTIVLIVLILLAGGLLFLKSDFAAERMRDTLLEILQEDLGIQASIGSCYVELLPPTVRLRKVKIAGKDEERLFEVDQLRVELDSLSLLAGRFQIDRLQIKKPKVYLAMKDGVIVNLPELPKSEAKSEEKPEEKGSDPDILQEFLVLLQRLEIEDAYVDLMLSEVGLFKFSRIWATLLVKGEYQAELLAELAHGTFTTKDDPEGLPPIEDLKVKVSLNKQNLNIQHISFHIEQLETLGNGRIRLASGGFEPNILLKIKSPMHMLKRFLKTVPQMEGFAKVEARVSKKEGILGCTGIVNVNKYGIEYAKDIEFTTEYAISPSILSLHNLEAKSRAGTVSGTAQLLFNERLGFKGDLKLKEVNLANSLLMADIQFSPVGLRGSGEVSFSGGFLDRKGANVTTNLKLGLTELAVILSKGDKPVFLKKSGKANASATFTGRSVKISKFQLGLNDSFMQGSGEISFIDGAVVGGVESSDLALKDISPVAGLDLAGLCKFTFNASQTVFDPRLEIALEVDGLDVNNRFVGALRGSLMYTDDRLHLERMLVARHGGVVRLMGTLGADPPYDVQGSVILDGASMPEVFAVVQGSTEPDFLEGQLVGQMEVLGTLEALDLRFNVAFNGVKIGNQEFEEGGVIGRMSDGAWYFELVEARMGPGWIFAQGEISKELWLNLKAYSTGLRAASFQRLTGLKDLLDFRLDLQVSVKGPVRSPSFSGWTKIYDAHLKEKKLPDSFFSAEVTSESFEVSGYLLGEASRLHTKVRLDADLPFELAFNFYLDRLGEYLAVMLPELDSKAKLKGLFEARGRLLDTQSIQGQLQIEELSITASNLGLRNKGLIVAKLKKGAFDIEQFELSGIDTALSITGGGWLFKPRVKSAPRLIVGPKIRVEGSVKLDGFAPFFSFLSRSVGDARVQFDVGGSWSSPTFLGRVRFSIDQLRFVDFGQDLERVNGVLDLKPGMLRFSSVQGRFGGGRFIGEGRLKLDGFYPIRAALDFEVDRVRYNVIDNLWGIATGTLGLTWKRGELWKLAGDVRVKEGEFRETNRLVPVNDDIFRRKIKKAHTYDVEHELLAFDIQVRIPGKFRVRYNMDIINFNAEMRGSLQLTGTNERLGLLGDLESINGVVSYLSSKFKLDSAQVRFVEEYSIRPQVDVLASLVKTVDRGIRGGERGGKTDYRIELTFRSDGENIMPVELKSDPWLEKHDIVSMLHFGFTTQDFESFKSKDMWEPILRAIEPATDKLLKKMFPFPPDVIQPTHLRVRSRMADQLGTVSPRLEIGAKLNVISPNWEVGYGRSLYNELDQSLELNINLSEGVSTSLIWEDTQRQQTPGDIVDLGLDLRLHWEW